MSGTGRWRSALAITLYAVGVASILATTVAWWLPGDRRREDSPLSLVPVLLTFLAYATVGLVILVRQPDNRVGWLVGAVGFFPMIGGSTELLVQRLPSWPPTDIARWVNTWYFPAAICTLPLLFLLFPDGRPASPRWRWPVAAALVAMAALLLRYMTGPGDCADAGCGSEDNPFQPSVLQPFMQTLEAIGWIGLLVGLIAGFASLAWRFRRARGVERQQVQWLAGSVLLALLLLPLQDWISAAWESDTVTNGLFAVLLALPALAIAVSVLRYHLYDIDRVLSRTLSYGLVTSLLVGVYLTLVAATTRVLPDGSSLAVAASTLAVAALFQPLRRRVQSLVDRRFNRARYDAARTVEDFSARLRAEVDLDAVRTDLLAVVDATLEPAHAALWLRPGRSVT